MRTSTATALLLTLFATSFVQAAQIYGTLTKDGRPLAGAKIVITCKGHAYEATTDKRGSYGVYAEETGKCSFSVPDSQVSTTISSYEDAAKYDFEIVRTDDGPVLKRK